MSNNICLVKRAFVSRLMAGWHCAIRGGGSVGEEN